MYVGGVALLVEMSEIDVAKYVQCIVAKPNSLSFIFTQLFIHVKLPSPILPNVPPVHFFFEDKAVSTLGSGSKHVIVAQLFHDLLFF